MGNKILIWSSSYHPVKGGLQTVVSQIAHAMLSMKLLSQNEMTELFVLKSSRKFIFISAGMRICR